MVKKHFQFQMMNGWGNSYIQGDSTFFDDCDLFGTRVAIYLEEELWNEWITNWQYRLEYGSGV